MVTRTLMHRYSYPLCILGLLFLTSCTTAPSWGSFASEAGADVHASFGSVENLLILGGAYGTGLLLDSSYTGHMEERAADYFDDHDFLPTGVGNQLDLVGSGIFLLGSSALWYGGSRYWSDPQGEAASLAMLSSLSITGITTLGLKAVFNDGRPNDSPGGYPSGHSSMAMAAAASLGESYGWKVGVPAYLTALMVGVQRLDSRKHDLDDVAAGLILGYVIGSSITDRRMPVVLGGQLEPILDPARGDYGIAIAWDF